MNNRYALAIAHMMAKDEDWKGEAKYALDAVYINPNDLRADELLEQADEKLGDAPGETREKTVIDIINKQEAAAAKAGTGLPRPQPMPERPAMIWRWSAPGMPWG